MLLRGTRKYILGFLISIYYSRKQGYPKTSNILLGALLLLIFLRRDITRETIDTDKYTAACDGHIDAIEPFHEDEERLNVSTYMHGYNSHVVRSPSSGTIKEIEHIPGSHNLAFTGKSRGGNEQLRIKYESGLEVHLIAGAFMRRTVAYHNEGDQVGQGERIGHIALSSRVRVILPKTVDRDLLSAEEGDKMLASQTVLCDSTDESNKDFSNY